MRIKNITDNFEIQELLEFPIFQQAFVHFDACHNKKHILYYNNGLLDILTLETGLLSTWRVPDLNSARQIKMNQDFLLLGVLISAKVLEIRVLYDPNPIIKIIRDDNVSDSILGFEWIFKDELMVLCTNGIFLYQISSNNQCSTAKKIKIRMNWYLYSPEINLLLISTGTPNLFMYRLSRGRVCETYPNLSLVVKRPVQNVIPEPITRLNVHLFTLYTHHYVGHLSNCESDTMLSLYRLSSKTLYRKESDFKLAQGIYSFNIVDNLLICHNLTTKTSTIIDIRSPKQSNPVLESLELFDFLGDSKPNDVELRELAPSSTFGPKNFILSRNAGRVYQLNLKLNPILDSMFSKGWQCLNITRFVLDRTYGIESSIRFKSLRVSLQKLAPVDEITPIFNLLSMHHDKIQYFKFIGCWRMLG